MGDDLWVRVDRYLSDLLIEHDDALDAALSVGLHDGVPEISVTPIQGKFLHLLAALQGARSILELGTFAGYSTIWLARALPPGGRLITVERSPEQASVAMRNLATAGLQQIVTVRVGPALEVLTALEDEQCPPFDFVFIDADKPSIPQYFARVLESLTRPGSVIVVDNVIRRGEILDASSPDPNVVGVRRFYEMVASDPRVSATAIPMATSKGVDGMALVLVNRDGRS